MRGKSVAKPAKLSPVGHQKAAFHAGCGERSRSIGWMRCSKLMWLKRQGRKTLELFQRLGNVGLVRSQNNLIL